jgi:hypothetical protein
LFLSKGSLCKLDLDLESELCQIVENKFFYLVYLFKMSKTQDLQSKFCHAQQNHAYIFIKPKLLMGQSITWVAQMLCFFSVTQNAVQFEVACSVVS